MKRRTKRRVVQLMVLCGPVVAAACLLSPRSVPKAPSESDVAAKTRLPSVTRARVYVHRLNPHPLFRYTNTVSVGQEALGVIAQKRYVVADVPQGTQVVVATTNADPGTGFVGSSSLSLELLGGHVYFVRVEVPFWDLKHPVIQQVEGVEGWRAVQKCKLALGSLP